MTVAVGSGAGAGINGGCGILVTGDLPRHVGSYRILRLLGRGGMGTVYLARSPGGRSVAVKVIRDDLALDPDFRRRFAREVAAARAVNAAYTAPVVDADTDCATPWLATVYVPGPSLWHAVSNEGVFRPGKVRTLGVGLAEALTRIHAAGVVHRDLKPHNVLLADDGPRVIDFGISRVSGSSAITEPGVFLGTPAFMSPEQFTGARISGASDVFSLGAVLTFAATGTGPFGEGTNEQLHHRILYREPELDRVPVELAPLIRRCLAKRPEDRPAPLDLLHGFDRCTVADEDRPTVVIPPPRPRPPIPPLPGHPPTVRADGVRKAEPARSDRRSDPLLDVRALLDAGLTDELLTEAVRRGRPS